VRPIKLEDDNLPPGPQLIETRSLRPSLGDKPLDIMRHQGDQLLTIRVKVTHMGHKIPE
jgi:hypothetical protein